MLKELYVARRKAYGSKGTNEIARSIPTEWRSHVSGASWHAGSNKLTIQSSMVPDVDVTLSGIAGTQGTTGTQGATGTQGTAGTQGTTGAQGADGASASQGTTGTQGAQGIQGQLGTQGAV